MARRLYLRQAAQGTGEIPDPTPVEASLAPAPLTLREEMRRFIKQELSVQQAEEGNESFEEADDFEVEDEPDLTSQYTVHELTEDPEAPDDLEGAPNQEDLDNTPVPAEPAEPAEVQPKKVDT